MHRLHVVFRPQVFHRSAITARTSRSADPRPSTIIRLRSTTDKTLLYRRTPNAERTTAIHRHGYRTHVTQAPNLRTTNVSRHAPTNGTSGTHAQAAGQERQSHVSRMWQRSSKIILLFRVHARFESATVPSTTIQTKHDIGV